MDALTFLMNLQSMYDTGVYANYYFFFAGHTVGAIAMDTLALVNIYAGFFDFQPMPQYHRYDPNHVYDPNDYQGWGDEEKDGDEEWDDEEWEK